MLFKNEIYALNSDVQYALDALEKDKEKDLKSRIHIFFNWLLEANKANPEKLRKELMDASIALKLALRTFREVDSDKKKKP